MTSANQTSPPLASPVFENARTAEPNPFYTIMQMAGGHAVSRSLHVIANLGVADALDENASSAQELAAAVGADADALFRVLRLLSAHGVFEWENGKFRHSPASRLLRSDHPQSMRALARMLGLPVIWNVYVAMEHSVLTGRPAAEKVLPGGLWAHFGEHPEESAIFNAAMAAKARGQVAGVVAAYDFSAFGQITDIGGGRGHLLQAVVGSVPTAKGVLFDLPHVIHDAAGLASDRLTLRGGDFFKDPLPQADAYLIMEVIHDWGDQESLAILGAIRRAARPHSKLLMIEQIVPDEPGPYWSKTLDVLMLTLLGGKQRTRQEYQAILERAGFSLKRVINTASDVSILEATPA